MEKVLNRLLLRNGSHWESSEARAGLYSSGSLCPGTCLSQPGLNHHRLNCRWVHGWDFQKHLILVCIYVAGTTPPCVHGHVWSSVCWCLLSISLPSRKQPVLADMVLGNAMQQHSRMLSHRELQHWPQRRTRSETGEHFGPFSSLVFAEKQSSRKLEVHKNLR